MFNDVLGSALKKITAHTIFEANWIRKGRRKP